MGKQGGLDKFKQQIMEIQISGSTQSGIQARDRHGNEAGFVRNSGSSIFMDTNSKIKEGNQSNIVSDGPKDVEVDGLKLE